MPVNSNDPWDLVSQVRRSKSKSRIVELLGEEPACASEIGDDLLIQTESAANYIRDLKQMNPPVVECITPDQPHHRLYALTEEGEFVLEHLR